MRSVEEVGRGGRSRRSGRPWYQAFSKTQSRSVSGERQPDSARLGSARLGSSRLISKISQIKKKGGGTAATHGAPLSVGNVGREVGRGGRSRRSGRPWYQAFQKLSLGQSQVRGSLTRLGSARLGLARLISKISQIKKKGRWYRGNALARRCRSMRSVEEVGRGGRSGRWPLCRTARLGSTWLGSSSARLWLGSAWLGSSRLGSSHFQNFSDKKKGWWYRGHVGRAGRGVGGSGGRRGS